MKIGILTFHSQLNYGGVLQAWALQQALIQLLADERSPSSDTVQIIDRWLDPLNEALLGSRVHYHWHDWIKYVFRLLLMLGDFAPDLRRVRTARFISKRLNLTKYHLHKFEELYGLPARHSPFDVVVVGSDQVWHAGEWGDPRPFLLEGLDPSAFCKRAVAYAASFGFTERQAARLELAAELGFWGRKEALPPGETLGAIYRRGLARFSAISCREAEGVRVAEHFGAKGAAHVVDPTLLVSPRIWDEFRLRRRHRHRRLFVYLLGETLESALPLLESFAAESGWKVDVFLDGPPGDLWFGPLPSSLRKFTAWWKAFRFRHGRRVRLCVEAGPAEFLKSIAAADGVVSDSFHALMFSIIYQRNVRILRPKSELRRAMFARIAEFLEHMHGALLADGILEALKSLRCDSAPVFDMEWLEARRSYSHEWLKSAVLGSG